MEAVLWFLQPFSQAGDLNMEPVWEFLQPYVNHGIVLIVGALASFLTEIIKKFTPINLGKYNWLLAWIICALYYIVVGAGNIPIFPDLLLTVIATGLASVGIFSVTKNTVEGIKLEKRHS